MSSPLDRSRWLGGIAPRGSKALGDQWQVLYAHVEDERSREARQRLPVEHRLRLGRVLVPGHESDRGGVVAVGDGDSGVGRRGDPGSHPGHDLEIDACASERLRLLAAATEDERVAALEPDDASPLSRVVDHQLLDLVLLHRVGSRRLADVDELGVGTRSIERSGGNQAIVQDHVSARDQLERTAGHQSRIARAGADEVDDAVSRAHASASNRARARITRAPAPTIRSTSSSPSAAGCAGSPAMRSRTHAPPSARPT